MPTVERKVWGVKLGDRIIVQVPNEDGKKEPSYEAINVTRQSVISRILESEAKDECWTQAAQPLGQVAPLWELFLFIKNLNTHPQACLFLSSSCDLAQVT